MPAQPQPPTLFQVVHRAVEVCDPDGADEAVTDFLLRFEDADEPARGSPELEQRLAEAAGRLDPEGDDPVLEMTRATATYLTFRRDELAEDPIELIRLAARAEYDGKPPEPVAGWLAEVGVDI